MQQWDRDTSGRLNRISTQLDPASEVSVHTDTMDPLPEEQQSQPGTPMNPNAYRTMRDHIHPPRVSAPSCIIPPAEDVAVRPYLVPLLPTYHGMENENPYTHIRDFEDVCTTFKEGMMDMDLLKLKAFPLTLKDKAKIWLNSLRPRAIRNWAELQAEFLKKFFSTHKTKVRAPNWQLRFEVMCDASDLAIGAVLRQREGGKPHVVYYASKTLNEAQRNYTTTEKELLAVVYALDKFRAYLVGSDIVIFKDHSLKYLLTKQNAKARLIRWVLLLQEFNLKIKDKKGVENVVADHLSRLTIAHDTHSPPINDEFPE